MGGFVVINKLGKVIYIGTYELCINVFLTHPDAVMMKKIGR